MKRPSWSTVNNNSQDQKVFFAAVNLNYINLLGLPRLCETEVIMFC